MNNIEKILEKMEDSISSQCRLSGSEASNLIEACRVMHDALEQLGGRSYEFIPKAGIYSDPWRDKVRFTNDSSKQALTKVETILGVK